MRDILGREFRFVTPPRRVVSLVPSITETLFDIGAGESVVGATDWCIFPPEQLAHVPRVGGTKNPNVDLIRELRPDLVYMNLEENLKKHGDLIGEFAPVFVTEPKNVADVVDIIEMLGEIHGHEREAAQIAEEIERELALPRLPPLRFACAIWKSPWMWCGGDTYVSALVESVGGKNVLRDEARYPAIEIAGIAERNPDIIFLPDEPYFFSESDADALRTVLPSRIIGPFPGHLLTWHGSRTLKGLRFARALMTG
jgi:ABC-type Fe3+-hydroxamate transport system substrate-binding protein